MTKPLPLKRGVRKIIFLDIDGVLNSVRSCAALRGYPWSFEAEQMGLFDEVALRLMRRAIEETGAKVVVSSTWRIRRTIGELAAGLDMPVVGKTPRNNDERRRGGEIKDWLTDHPEVTAYAIVDDDSDMLEEQHPFFVHTDGKEGFLFRDYEKLMAILGPAKEEK